MTKTHYSLWKVSKFFLIIQIWNSKCISHAIQKLQVSLVQIWSIELLKLAFSLTIYLDQLRLLYHLQIEAQERQE